MSATAALKHTQFSELHGALKAKVMARAAQFQAARGYRPPYWELIRFVRDLLRPVDAPL